MGFDQASSELLNFPVLSLIFGFALFFAISFISSLLLPLYFEEQRSRGLDEVSTFNKVYFYFHLLVVAALVFMELGILHTWGLNKILLTLGAMEWLWAMYWWKHSTATVATAPTSSLKDDFQRYSQLLVPLFAFSVVSGIIQSILYRQVQNVLAPLAFHYSLYLAALILSWALASLWFRGKLGYKLLSWNDFKKHSAILILSLLVWSLSWPVFWAAIMEFIQWPDSSSATFLQRSLFCVGLILPTGFFFGSLLPLVKKENDQIPLGTYLAVNCTGNAVGIALFISFLFEVTGIFQLWTLLGLLCLFFANKEKKMRFLVAAISLVLCTLTYFLITTFSWSLGSYSHRNLTRWVKDSRSVTDVKVFKHNSSEVNFVELDHTHKLMIMNGHHSINLPSWKSYSPADTFMGLTPLSYVNKYDKALVIGLGTGTTVMGAADLFTHVDVVDLDPTMLKVLDFMPLVAEKVKSKNVKFTEADGLTFLRTQKLKYDLIVNNVPSPVYFAAAKLWSREALEAVYDSLADHGIFAQWLDGELSLESINILLQTSQDLFKHCDMFYLQFNFYSLVCSKGDHPLTLHKHPPASAKLMQTDSQSYADFFEALRFPAVNTTPQNPDVPMNTLDQPYMDVLVARRPPGWVGDPTRDNIVQYYKLYELVDQEAALKSPAMDKKCRIFSNWIFHKEFKDKGEACSRIF
ncbi:spermidine synthase [Bdellovibrio sp. HCB185ZH]|uniref:spermidine synthase n=1 Tax=Bdellovibrio sp. HCB185ZH TaxID=3394235 RepID=UPI0039A57138